MILGMSVAAFTLLHVVISVIAIATGLIVVAGWLGNRRLPRWTAVFLATTVLTSATGFLFHSKAIGPPHIIGALSLVILAVALYALYGRQLAGGWRKTYLVTALLSLYLNVFVLVVQAFQKIPVLNQFAPKGSEPPFAVAQLLVLVLFVLLGIKALRLFHPGTVPQPG